MTAGTAGSTLAVTVLTATAGASAVIASAGGAAPLEQALPDARASAMDNATHASSPHRAVARARRIMMGLTSFAWFAWSSNWPWERLRGAE